MVVELGKYKGNSVCFDTDDAMNGHILLLGKSGSGKTVEAQKIIAGITGQGGTVLALDMHQTLAEDQIFWKYKGDFASRTTEIDVYKAGIQCDLFGSLLYEDGTREHPADTVDAVANVLAGTLSLGLSQKAVLRTALGYVVQEGTFEAEGFVAIKHSLEGIGGKTAEGIQEKMHQLFEHNIFRYGQWPVEEGRINIVRLGKFSLGTQELVAEMLISYIWRLAMMGHFKKKGLFLFADEIQNLPSGKMSALAQILSEGRKFNLNLILATQQLMQGNASVVQQRLTQCGTLLFFQPDANRVSQIVRIIEPTSGGEWGLILRKLKCGEFIARGQLTVGGCKVEYPIKVSAVVEPSRNEKSVGEAQEFGCGRGMVTNAGIE